MSVILKPIKKDTDIIAEDKGEVIFDDIRDKLLTMTSFTGDELAPVLENIAAIDNAIDRDALIELTKQTAKENGVTISKSPLQAEVKKFIAKHEKERVKEGGSKAIDNLFQGSEMVWDPDRGAFCEINDSYTTFYPKQTFTQTVSSLSSIPQSGCGDMIASIPLARVLYKPDKKTELTHKGARAINVYRPVIFDSENKGIPHIIDKLLDNIFESDMEAKDVFINWLAYIVQYKKKTGVAWGFFGAQGSGKGVLCELVCELVGRENSSMEIGDTTLESAFNDFLMHKLFIQLDEISSDMHGRKGVAGKLKRMVTSPTLQINQKFIKAVEIDNYCNFILNSNKPNPLELDPDDRRWNMVVTRTSLKGKEWWNSSSRDEVLNAAKSFGKYLTDIKVGIAKATTAMEISIAKQQVINNTMPIGQLLSTAIDECNYNELIEIAQLESSDIWLSELKWSCENKMFENDLISYLYQSAKGDGIFENNKTKSIRRVKSYFKHQEMYKIHRNCNENGQRKRGYRVV